MLGEEDVLFRPITMKQMYKAESLLDGTVDLQFVMLCNEAIDIEIENTRRHEVWRKQNGG